MAAGPGLVRLAKRSGAPRSMSGCEALRDVAEGCFSGRMVAGVGERDPARRGASPANPSESQFCLAFWLFHTLETWC